MVKKNIMIAYLCMLFLCCTLLIIPFLFTKEHVEAEQIVHVMRQHPLTKDMIEADTRMIRRFYHLDSNQYASATVLMKESMMEVEEAALFTASDQFQQEEIIEACKAHIANQIASFEGYGDAQVQLLKQAVIVPYGDHVICIVSKYAEELRQEIEQGKGMES